MGNVYDDFLGKSEDNRPTADIIDGTFACQICDEYVDEAYWYRSKNLLVWKCEAGHESFIEDFSI